MCSSQIGDEIYWKWKWFKWMTSIMRWDWEFFVTCVVCILIEPCAWFKFYIRRIDTIYFFLLMNRSHIIWSSFPQCMIDYIQIKKWKRIYDLHFRFFRKKTIQNCTDAEQTYNGYRFMFSKFQIKSIWLNTQIHLKYIFK